MAAPPNTTAATALTITLPYSTILRADDAGTTYDVWYRLVVPTCLTLIGVFPYGDATAYTPRVQMYQGPLDSLLTHYVDSGNNQPAQNPVTPGVEYFIKIRTNAGNPSPAN